MGVGTSHIGIAPITAMIFTAHPAIQRDFVRVLCSRKGFRITAYGHLAQVGIFDGEMSAAALKIETLCRQFSQMYPLLVASCNEQESLRWLAQGVVGIVDYECYRKDLPRAVKHVAEGRIWCTANIFRLCRCRPGSWGAGLSDDLRTLQLSEREQEVVTLLAQHLSNKEIACRLNITERTVKFHVSNIFLKFRVTSRDEMRERLYTHFSKLSSVLTDSAVA